MHEPVLTPDYTLFIQAAIFFATYFVLNSLVFKPFLALLKERRDQTFGLRQTAEKDKVQAETVRSEYEAFMKAERKKVLQWTEEERKKVHDEERRIIQNARDAAAKLNEAARAGLEEERTKALRSLESAVNEFSSAIVSKMLGRKVSVSGAAASKSKNAESTVET